MMSQAKRHTPTERMPRRAATPTSLWTATNHSALVSIQLSPLALWLADNRLDPFDELLKGGCPASDSKHFSEELVMSRLELIASKPKTGTKQRSARSLVAIHKGMVADDAVAEPACFCHIAAIELDSPERLMGPSKCRLQHSFVAHAVDATELLYCSRMDSKDLALPYRHRPTHLASPEKTSAYSSMKSTATSSASSVAVDASWMITHGLLFLSTVTRRPVRFTSAVTFEKLGSSVVGVGSDPA